MKIHLYCCLLVFLPVLACKKSKDPLTGECLRVRWAGKGCDEVLQVLTPVNSPLLQVWQHTGISDEAIANCISIESLDDQFKNSSSFFIRIQKVRPISFRRLDCTGPEYIADYQLCEER